MQPIECTMWNPYETINYYSLSEFGFSYIWREKCGIETEERELQTLLFLFIHGLGAKSRLWVKQPGYKLLG